MPFGAWLTNVKRKKEYQAEMERKRDIKGGGEGESVGQQKQEIRKEKKRGRKGTDKER